jgi:hypothetical protein
MRQSFLEIETGRASQASCRNVIVEFGIKRVQGMLGWREVKE